MRRTAKYEPLQTHLKSAGFDRIRMTFEEIERVIGTELPRSARRHRAWWSNNPSNSVITYAWLSVGYKTERVSMEREVLTFRKDRSIGRPQRSAPEGKAAGTHPVIACMSGTVTIPRETDLTEPSLPEWKNISIGLGICNE